MFGKRLLQRQNILIFTLVIFSLVILFFDLGKRSLWEPDEGRYGEISREMLESGDWLTPRLNYIKHFAKPPVTYWLIGSSLRLFGQNEFSAHLPLVLLGLAGVLATFYLGKNLFGHRCGFLSAIILISTLGYPALARVLSTDIVLTSFVLFCYLFFVRKSYFLFYLSMALGFLTKGPVVFLLTLLPICIYLIYEREKYTFKEMRWGWGAVLFSAIALPWFIYEIYLNKGLLYNWTFHQTLTRITGKAGKEPFYFFLPVLIGLFFPWVFFLPAALKRNFSLKKTLLLLLWFGLAYVFFSCIGKKLVPYILPLLAPLAIITARLWDEAMDNPKILSSRIFSASYYTFLCSLAIIVTAIITFLAGRFDYKFGIQPGRPNMIAIAIILAAGAVTTLIFFKQKRPRALFAAIALTCALFFIGSIDLLPKIEVNINKSIKGLALKIKEDLRPEDKVVNYRCFLKSLPFYLGRRTIVVERQRNLIFEENPKHHQDYLLKDKKDLYNLLSRRDIRVFCITYTWEFEKIRQEYPRPLLFLGKAGKYVLFTNQKIRE